jgi:hypothetical protein
MLDLVKFFEGFSAFGGYIEFLELMRNYIGKDIVTFESSEEAK